MDLEKLTPEEITEALTELPGWELLSGRDALFKKFKFPDFRTAWAFMQNVAEEADEMSHHPEWANVYNRVEVTLTTHDVGGVSELDLELAHFMEEMVAANDA
jgi:4a-hydroxytetrahydrobiopterin dehydratase